MEYIRREVPEEQLSLSGLETKLEASPRWFGAYEGQWIYEMKDFGDGAVKQETTEKTHECKIITAGNFYIIKSSLQ